jgi:hypothetical protein
MKKVLKYIWEFLNSRIALYIGIIVAIILFVGTCNRNFDLKDILDRKDQNISALTDSITTIKLRNGELQTSRNAYMGIAKELEKYNKKLSDDVKAQKGKVVTLNNIIFNLKQDTAELRKYIRELERPKPPQPENDSTWRIFWNLNYVYDSDNYDIFKGTTRIRLNGPVLLQNVLVSHLNTELTYRDSQIGLSWGQKWEGSGKDKKLKVFAQTAHPAFQTKLLEGVYVDYPEKKHWFTGFGIGPQLGIGYNPINQNIVSYLGVGIQYNIYQW